ncbi:MAG: glycosyltransferase, partial [Actinomycetota bacterium]|nr:glycosyltransferase [Actinomycetota bacterium]
LAQHSRYSRVNVDVFLEDQTKANRWLAVTPDTYRARLSLPSSGETTEFVTVVDPALSVSQELTNRALVTLGDSGIGAGVVGEVDGPRLAGRHRTEPVVGPRLIAVRRNYLDEVGGIPDGEHPLPGLLARLRDAGHRIGLIPIPGGDAPTTRTDPITRAPVVILSGVPLHDIGGGSRSTQLAVELVRQGYHVTLVALYEAQESVDLGLRYIHPHLEQSRVERFDADVLLGRVASAGLALVEAPAASLLVHAKALQAAGWELVYDMIDDWSDPALGGEWYRQAVEQELISSADRVSASAPDLVRRVEAMGREAVLVPNAVNVAVFGADHPRRPADLPEAETIIGYHGSLYGDWFDWDSLRRVAEANPRAAVVLIGDDKTAHPVLPPNVRFLGLKPQTDLPGYLQRFDVGLVPFSVNETTHAVSPLKAYEYLGSGVPIAAPPLRALEGMEGVHTDSDLVSAVASALAALRPDRALALKDHSWENRVVKLTGSDAVVVEYTPVSVVARPAIHYDRPARLVVGLDDPES